MWKCNKDLSVRLLLIEHISGPFIKDVHVIKTFDTEAKPDIQYLDVRYHRDTLKKPLDGVVRQTQGEID